MTQDGAAFWSQVFHTAPEVKVYFAGQTADASDAPDFGVESRVVWPMAGGTALITFEEEQGECDEEEEEEEDRWRPES